MLRKLKRPEIWFESNDNGDGRYQYTIVRIFYPDGESEYMELNSYYKNGDVLVKGDYFEWIKSYGPKSGNGAWHPDTSYEDGRETLFLGYL